MTPGDPIEPSHTDHSAPQGLLVIPDHTLLRSIGRGSYGEVWLARSTTGAIRAVKVIHKAKLADDLAYQREFSGIRHFEPISRSHEGFVDVLHVGRDDERGYFYYVMEIADNADAPGMGERTPGQGFGMGSPGGVLPPYTAETLEVRARRDQRLPAKVCLDIGLGLIAALKCLHGHGLVHRDIKPSNIIYVGGRPKLADVGAVAQASTAMSLVGTLGFIPPEGPGTIQADIYALGKCLYEVAMGRDRRAFPSPATRLTELPDQRELLELNQVISRACDPDPRRRYLSCTQMEADLLLLQRGGSIRRRVNVHRWLRSTAALVAIVAILALWRSLPRDSQRTKPNDKSAKGTAAHLPDLSGPQLRVIASFETPVRWQERPVPGDYKGDGSTALYFGKKGELAVCSWDGQVVAAKVWPRSFGDNFRLNRVAPMTGDGMEQMIIDVQHPTRHELWVLDKRLNGRYCITTEDTAWQSERRANANLLDEFKACYADPTHLLAQFRSSITNVPRDLTMWSLPPGDKPVWRIPIASCVLHGKSAKSKSDGRALALLGTYAPDHGFKLGSGRDDSHSEVLVIDLLGNILLQETMGGALTETEPYWAEGSKVDAVVVRCTRGDDNEFASNASGGDPLPAWGCVTRYELEPSRVRMVASNSWDSAIWSLRQAVLPRYGQVVLVTDSQGRLHVLASETLTPLWEGTLSRKRASYVALHLVDGADLDGDGHQEIILMSGQVRIRGQSSMKDQDEFFITEVELVVLDDQLRQVVRQPLPDTFGTWPQSPVLVRRSAPDLPLLLYPLPKITLFGLVKE